MVSIGHAPLTQRTPARAHCFFMLLAALAPSGLGAEPHRSTSAGVHEFREKLGGDPESVTRFVESEIAYESYSGALRGARGALSARAGNTLDRALLASALLEGSGFETRIVRGGSVEPHRASRSGSSSQLAPRSTLADEILASASSHFLLIAEALDRNGVSAPASTEAASAPPPGPRFGLQVRRDGSWMDLQVSGAHGAAVPVRPADLGSQFFSLSFVLEVELERAGAIGTQALLGFTETAANLAAVPVGYVHRVGREGVEVHLLVGSDRRSATLRGSPKEAAEKNDPVGSTDSLFRRLPMSPRSPEQQAPSAEPAYAKVLAETLVVRVEGPGVSEELRHRVFESRESGDETASESWERLSDTAFAVTTLVGAMRGSDFRNALSSVGNPLDAAGVVSTLTALNLAYQVARNALPASYFGDPLRRYLDQPNLLVSVVSPSRRDETAAALTLDLMRKSYRIAPASGDNSQASSLFYEYIANGVLDHAVERTIAVDGESVGQLVEQMDERGEVLQVLRPGEERRQGRTDHPIHERLAQGMLLLVPSPLAPDMDGPWGWWEIDPRTGWTVDTIAGGGHQVQVEYDVGLIARITPSQRFRNFACTLAVVAGSAGGQIGELLASTGDPAAAGILLAAEGLESAGGLGCGGKHGVTRGAWRQRVPGWRMGNRGFKPNGFDPPRRPWRGGSGRVDQIPGR